MAVKPVPDGYTTISPMLVCDRPQEVFDFVTKAFDTKLLTRIKNSDGSLMAADLQVGTASISIVEANAEMPAYQAVLYLYVPDADKTYSRCLTSGAQSLHEPKDEPHGDRMAGITDPAGNQWWIASRIEDLSQDELERRMQNYMQQEGLASG